MEAEVLKVSTLDVKSKLINVRGQLVLLDKDVAVLYGVQTREVNQAVKNNPEKFPKGYILELTEEESTALRSKILILEKQNLSKSGRYSKFQYKAFSEQGLYMLATILKGHQAINTTLAIIDTFVQVRQLSRTMEQLQTVADGCPQQQTILQKTGEILAEIIGRNLSTDSTETEIELNFAVVKIRHKVTKKKE